MELKIFEIFHSFSGVLRKTKLHARVTNKFTFSLCLFLIPLLSMSCYGQVRENLAPLASLSGSGEDLQTAVDGV